MRSIVCGRASLTASGEEIAEAFGLAEAPDLAPRYNMAPGQEILTVRREGGALRQARMVRWGLPRGWAGAEGGGLVVNARAESVARKPAFRDAFRRRRCLVPVTGFFEWRRRGRTTQPWLVRRHDGRPFALGALWERMSDGEGPPVESSVVLTTEPNALVAALHDRMPVIVPIEAYELWLDDRLDKLGRLDPFLAPAPDDVMEAYPVSESVNRVEVDGPECIQPAREERQKSLF